MRTNKQMKEYWKKNPDKYHIHKKKVNESNKIPKNRKRLTDDLKRFRLENPEYYKEWRKKNYEDKGLCHRCGKKRDTEKLNCTKCLRRSKEYRDSR